MKSREGGRVGRKKKKKKKEQGLTLRNGGGPRHAEGGLLALDLQQHAKILANLHQLIAIVGSRHVVRVARSSHGLGDAIVHGGGHRVVTVPSGGRGRGLEGEGARAVQLGRGGLGKEGGDRRQLLDGAVTSRASSSKDGNGQGLGSGRVVECGASILFLDLVVHRVGL